VSGRGVGWDLAVCPDCSRFLPPIAVGASIERARPAGSTNEAADPSVAARVQAYARSGDPSTLWPGLTETARVAALHEIERITRAVLAGGEGLRVDPSEAHATYALLIAGHTSGTGTLLGRWIADGIAVAREDVALGFSTQLAHARRRADRIARELAPALDALEARGVKPVALRGFHTGRVYFQEPGLRRMADVDLLVPPRQIDQAEAALRGIGFRPTTPVLRPYRRDWIGPGESSEIFSVEVEDERNRWNVDLHTSLDRLFHPGAVARLDSELDEVDPIDIDGRSLLVLRAPLLLLSLASHCSQELHANRLLRLVEIVRVIRAERASGRLDWGEFLSMTKRTGAARFTYPALALAEDLAPGTVDPRALAVGRHASTWAARHAVERLSPAGGSSDSRGALRQLMWTRGSVAVLHWLLCAVWPGGLTRPRDFLYGWRGRLRRLREGRLSLRAPNERGTS
jgi:putative nucleotidyltransferase-like protein